MTEKELVEFMYQKHKKWMLNSKEAPYEWGSSYSSLSKLFGGKNALPEKLILVKKIIPPWTTINKRRMWKLTDIAKWLIETEGTK
ncbi:hypothetical protein WCX18_00805 [Sulfurimonas sp. HSL1-2]|uniref:hypothetical protein n=1 Tax=Thiomicrolovo zhangzhouensis TaxID=3131933 RepID=UPI0031F9A4D0